MDPKSLAKPFGSGGGGGGGAGGSFFQNALVVDCLRDCDAFRLVLLRSKAVPFPIAETAENVTCADMTMCVLLERD